MATLELERPLLSRTGIDDIADKVYEGERLTFQDGVRLFHHHNLPELGALADHVRRRLHPETNDLVTYVVGRNVNYTNVCWVRCKFCAFYRVPGHEEGYTLSREQIFDKVQQMVDAGGMAVAHTLTDGRGAFRFDNVTPGDYQLDIQKDGFRQIRIPVKAGAKPLPLRVVLPISVPNQEIAVRADETASQVGTEMAQNQNANTLDNNIEGFLIDITLRSLVCSHHAPS